MSEIWQWNWNLQLFAEGGDDEGDKTEDPTPKRRKEAREKGQVAKSSEITAAAGLLGVMFLLMLLSGVVFHAFENMFKTFMSTLALQPVSEMNIEFVANETVSQFFILTVPVMAVAFVVGIVANVAQVGFLLVGESLKPKFEKINPIEGFKRMFSRRSLFNLFKSLLKIGIIGTAAFYFLSSRVDELLAMMTEEAGITAQIMWDIIVWLGLIVALVYLILGFLDFIYERYEMEQQLKMSPREIKDEHKQTEGDPEVRKKIRKEQQDVAQKRSLQDVPEADVVITNPQEVAVALRYNQKEDNAPVLVAKGVERIARQIKDIAREHEVPIIENPPVARMLWRHTEIGEEIPVDLYQTVAEILAMVYRMKRKQKMV